MKNIILVDGDQEYIDEFLSRGYIILVLVLNTDKDRDEFKQKYNNHTNIKYIVSKQDIDHINAVEYLDYEFICACRHIQREQEFVTHRWLNNGMLSANAYYNALFFWKNIFDTFDIYFVFIPSIKLGRGYEISSDIAKIRKIPAFFLPPIGVNNDVFIQDVTNDYCLEIPKEYAKTDLYDTLFYTFNPKVVVYQNKPKNTIKHIKRIGHRILHSVGGQLLVDFVMCLLKRNWNLTQHVGNYPFHILDKYRSYRYVKKMKKYYNKISVSPDFKEQYVFYAIHFEPEGGTCVTVTLQNQLTIIQMLSKAMPQGVKLYVKEHPHQFALNNATQSYYFYNISWWKNIEFYNEIKKLDNVCIIDFHTPSKILIQNCLAVSTINGTICLESIFLNKPVLAFGAEYFPFSIKNIISIDSFKKLKDVMEELVINPKKYVLEDNTREALQKVSVYFFDCKQDGYKKKIVEILDMYCEEVRSKF